MNNAARSRARSSPAPVEIQAPAGDFAGQPTVPEHDAAVDDRRVEDGHDRAQHDDDGEEDQEDRRVRNVALRDDRP